MENQTQTKISKWALWVSIISLIVSASISLFTFIQTNETSKQLLEYQLEQDRLPRIMALNYELPVEIVHIDNGHKNIDFSSISSELYPIKIPIYNVGVGFAQNCSIVWDKKSVNDACTNIANLLSQYCNVHEFELSEVANESGTYWAYQDFIFSKRDNEYDKVSYHKYYFSPDNLSKYDYELTEAAIMCEDIRLPYMLPVLNQASPSYVAISDGLSVLLLEIANQKIYAPISFCFDVNYQDLTGLDYTHSIKTTFLLNNQEDAPQKSFFEVSFEIIENKL